MAVSVSVANKNKADIRDGNEYKIPKWLVLKFHGSGHLPKMALKTILCTKKYLTSNSLKIPIVI
jgi:hypothetical protein